MAMARQLTYLLVLCVPGLCLGQVYKSVGPDGKVTYSDGPPASAAKVEQKSDIRARPLRPEDDPLTAAMQVYVKVTLVEEGSGKKYVYSVLGPWDVTDDHIINYLAPIAHGLLGRTVGELGEMPATHGGQVRIAAIERL